MKAVIKVGGKQYIVTEKQTLLVDRLADDTKTVDVEPLMVFDEKTATVGTPVVKGASVKAKVLEGEVKGDKVRIMKFKAKKRVKTLTGHRQKYTKIEIESISAK
jgi:large subunit ribosomal protein L21